MGYGAELQLTQEETTSVRERELQRKKWKWMISALLSIPLLWAMVGHFSFTSGIYVPELFMNPWFQLLLATPVQFVIGWQFYIGAYKALVTAVPIWMFSSHWVPAQRFSIVCI